MSANQTLQYWVTHHEKKDTYQLGHCSRDSITAIWLQFLIQNTKAIQVYCLFLNKKQYYQSTFCFKKFLKSKLICQLLQLLMHLTWEVSSQNPVTGSKEVSDPHTERELPPSHQVRPQPPISKAIQQLPFNLMILNRPSKKPTAGFQMPYQIQNSDPTDCDTTSQSNLPS